MLRAVMVGCGTLILLMTGVVSLARDAAADTAYFFTYITYHSGLGWVMRADTEGGQQTVLVTSDKVLGQVKWLPGQMRFAILESAFYLTPRFTLYGWNGVPLNPIAKERKVIYGDQLDWSPDGTEALVHLTGAQGLAIDTVLALAKTPRWLTYQPVTNGAWSPDGEWIAYGVWGRRTHSLYLMRSDGTERRLLVEDMVTDEATPQWSSDGARVLFRRRIVNGSSVTYHLHDIRPDGQDERGLVTGAINVYNPQVSPDGAWIAFHDFDVGRHQSHLMVVPSEGGNPVRLVEGLNNISAITWSPDSQTILFVGDPLGQPPDVYAVQVDGSAMRQVTDTAASEGGLSWSPNYAQGWEPGTVAGVGIAIAAVGLTQSRKERTLNHKDTKNTKKILNRRKGEGEA